MSRQYDEEYKIQAVKLAKEINEARAAKEFRNTRRENKNMVKECRNREFIYRKGSR